jgi:hypothetical protein
MGPIHEIPNRTHGKTHGGVISEEVEKAILTLIKKK